jgi:hypothetical protein
MVDNPPMAAVVPELRRAGADLTDVGTFVESHVKIYRVEMR